jgi:hypothetical protein
LLKMFDGLMEYLIGKTRKNEYRSSFLGNVRSKGIRMVIRTVIALRPSVGRLVRRSLSAFSADSIYFGRGKILAMTHKIMCLTARSLWLTSQATKHSRRRASCMRSSSRPTTLFLVSLLLKPSLVVCTSSAKVSPYSTPKSSSCSILDSPEKRNIMSTDIITAAQVGLHYTVLACWLAACSTIVFVMVSQACNFCSNHTRSHSHPFRPFSQFIRINFLRTLPINSMKGMNLVTFNMRVNFGVPKWH